MKRRDFLKTGLLAGASAAVHPREARSQIVRPRVSPSARNVIFYAYDGFNWQDFSRARNYALRHQSRTLAIERLFSLGVAGNQMTHSLTSIVTDSAAASTTWATGRKAVNGQLSVFPDGRKLTTLLELAQSVGKATGLITTTRLTHATPAGFAAHVDSRGSEDDVALEYLAFRPDVLLGGGRRHFDASQREDGRDLFTEFAGHGYEILSAVEDLSEATGSRVLGAFAQSHLPYEIDRRFQGVPSPTLADMASKGLEILSGCTHGFVVQIEAGRIDHANHANDPGACVWDVLAADEALEVVLTFADHNPDTLVVLASDHGTGGGAIYGVGADYGVSSELYDRINDCNASYAYMLAEIGERPNADVVRDVVARHTGVRLTSAEVSDVLGAIAGDAVLPFQAAYYDQPANSLAYVLASGGGVGASGRLNVNYMSGEHTSEPVPIALYGSSVAGAQLGLVDNTAPYTWVTDAIGVEHQNPLMSEQEARRLLAETVAPE